MAKCIFWSIITTFALCLLIGVVILILHYALQSAIVDPVNNSSMKEGSISNTYNGSTIDEITWDMNNADKGLDIQPNSINLLGKF